MFIGVFVILPAAAIFIVYKLVQWYRNREEKPRAPDSVDLIFQSAILQLRTFPDERAFLNDFGQRFAIEYRERCPADQIVKTVIGLASYYYSEEYPPLNPPPVVRGGYEDAVYREYVTKYLKRTSSLSLFTDTLFDVFRAFIKRLPPTAMLAPDQEDDPSATKIPLTTFLHDKAIISDVTAPFYQDRVKAAGLFQTMRDGHDAEQNPTNHKGSFKDTYDAFLANNPLSLLFECNVPFDIPLSKQLEHTMIVAQTGWGKTQLLQSMLVNYLNMDDPPAVILLDSTGAMIRRVQRLTVFDDRLKDRILIIDPEADPAPSLNMFHVSDRMKGYTGIVKEEVEGEIIELFNYVFAATAREMTGRQSNAFSYMVRVVLSLKEPTIDSLRDLLADQLQDRNASVEHSAFREAIEALDSDGLLFFRTFYYSTGFKGTRAAVLERLLGLMRTPAFKRMFSTSSNTLDMFDVMNKGQIVLVNTSQRLLKESGSPLFARYLISRALAGAFERATLDEKDRKPAFLIIDEAAPVFDETFEVLLTRVRQYKLGITIAFQHLDQLDDRLRSAIVGNTSIKYIGRVGYSDARSLSREMATTPERIQSVRKTDTHTEFTCYVNGLTDDGPVTISIPFGTLENLPKMTDAAHIELMERNRARTNSPEPAIVEVETAAAEPEKTPAAAAAPKPSKRTTAPDDWA